MVTGVVCFILGVWAGLVVGNFMWAKAMRAAKDCIAEAELYIAELEQDAK